jgi:hypothetical protein
MKIISIIKKECYFSEPFLRKPSPQHHRKEQPNLSISKIIVMQQRFRYAKILFAVLVVGYFLPSCHSDNQENQKLEDQLKQTLSTLNGIVAARGKRPHLNGDTIFISAYNTMDSTLTLVDNNNNDATEVVCKRSQNIHWSTSIPHFEIKNIDAETIWIGNDPDFYKAKPSANNPQNWKVTLKDAKDKRGSSVHYYIQWFLDTDPGTIYTYDPLMQLNPIN